MMSASTDRASRRQFIARAAAGAGVAVLGGYYLLDDDLTKEARAQTTPEGKPRLPPGQRALKALRPMGGEPGPADPRSFRLRIHGEVEAPQELDYAALLAMPQVDVTADVHCVTGWSLLGATYRGVTIASLAARAGIKSSARYVIIEAAHGYTANVPLDAAMIADALVTYRMNGRPFATPHGAPARALIPSRYFWKSAKWITGIRFAKYDAPGYWETRGYHNNADPWREERYG